MSPPIKGPLEQHLEPAVDDARLQKVAQRLKAARTAPAPRRLWPYAVAAAALIAVAVVWLKPAPVAPLPGPLALADDGALPEVLEGRSWHFADDSTLTLEDGAAVQVVANQPSQLTLLVRRGKGRFHVTPGGPRKWVVEAGLVSVEVVGTLFTVDRQSDGVCVSVERGSVIVRGDHLPDRLVRLDAGKSTCARPEPVADVPAPSPAPEPTPAPAPLPAPKPTADALLAAADRARAAGNDTLAAQQLAKLLEDWPGDASAPSAAFTLGRLELERLQRPADAARHFTLAARSPALAGDARLRQVEALAAAGNLAAAEAAARAAIEAEGNSTRTARLQRWLADPQHAASWLH
ncbi:MAG: FecR domain-containing protein [Myxococcaceae bacterium]|nr:FecR domain-containing protein [Myxococcaceae bacterium]